MKYCAQIGNFIAYKNKNAFYVNTILILLLLIENVKFEILIVGLSKYDVI